MDIRQTKDYARHLEKLGWIVEEKDGIYYFIRKLPLIGSFLKLQRPKTIDLETINTLKKKHRVFKTIIEPNDEEQKTILINAKFKQSTSPYLPSKTVLLDLRKTEDELLNNFKKDVKYALRKTEKIKLSDVEDLAKFRNTWEKSVPFSRYVPSLKNLEVFKTCFDRNFLVLECKEYPAGAVFLIGDKTAYYWLAFTSKKGRKALIQYKIVWEGIKWSKKMGAKELDFEGIFDERFPLKSWHGFTHFKKSFGGVEKEYPGAFVK